MLLFCVSAVRKLVLNLRSVLGRSSLSRQRKATKEVHIGLVGKYDLQDAYKSIREGLLQAGTYNDRKNSYYLYQF